MESSISKALIMAAGVLLAMLVMAFVTFSFRRIGEWAAVDDNEILTEQIDKFNKEYEAYDKNLMYGVDVISCLNKAKSNNDAIKGNYAEKVDTIYEVQVKVELNSSKTLEESIEVYHIKQSTNGRFEEIRYEKDEGPKNGASRPSLSDAGFEFLKDTSSNSYLNISTFKETDNLVTKPAEKCKITNTTFILSKDGNKQGEAEIRALLSTSSAMSETIKGKNGNDENGWSKAIFKSGLYDLKTRKFKCSNIKYNAQTGRLNYIEFTEVS